MEQVTVAVIGLGYVGLPLAVEFGKAYPTIGFDIDGSRVIDLRDGADRRLEVEAAELSAAQQLLLTSDPEDLLKANVFIVAVPTPIDQHKRPDLRPLETASATVAAALRPGDTVIYESTVYPGATEEVCVPILEAGSGLVLNEDFGVGYSPERINPGDRDHRLTSVTKVTSGSSPRTADFVDRLYASIVPAGTHRAGSIRVAEAAKVIENVQRDVNIALVNELALLFNKLGIDTREVLAAAGTKWNFLPFRPGLVGGHCIGVDPYYLTHKAQEVGHHPEVILAGRRINDGMGTYVADQVVLHMARRGIPIGGSRVLVLGLAFKQNCPDVRNTRVIDVVDRLREYGCTVLVHDPRVDHAAVKHEYGLDLTALDAPAPGSLAAIVLAVAHDEFASLGASLRQLLFERGVVYDAVGGLDQELVDARL